MKNIKSYFVKIINKKFLLKRVMNKKFSMKKSYVVSFCVKVMCSKLGCKSQEYTYFKKKKKIMIGEFLCESHV